MPENGDNFYQNISLARKENSHENDICCSRHLNVNVLKKATTKNHLQIILHGDPLFPLN